MRKCVTKRELPLNKTTFPRQISRNFFGVSVIAFCLLDPLLALVNFGLNLARQRTYQ